MNLGISFGQNILPYGKPSLDLKIMGGFLFLLSSWHAFNKTAHLGIRFLTMAIKSAINQNSTFVKIIVNKIIAVWNVKVQ